MERRETSDGAVVYVDPSHAERGSDAPFYRVYATPDGRRRWGFYCANCESLDTAMDTMGRIVCNRCPNQRKPTEWDAAHE